MIDNERRDQEVYIYLKVLGLNDLQGVPKNNIGMYTAGPNKLYAT